LFVALIAAFVSAQLVNFGEQKFTGHVVFAGTELRLPTFR